MRLFFVNLRGKCSVLVHPYNPNPNFKPRLHRTWIVDTDILALDIYCLFAKKNLDNEITLNTIELLLYGTVRDGRRWELILFTIIFWSYKLFVACVHCLQRVGYHDNWEASSVRY